ncbi:nicotinamide riboside transporter PnuC [Mucilaginibacter aquatilis]|uniref:Nicotinamide riboside transporter PnuC n=1 Tax=Mucilaginibacter aquatilis TaxID=1517760 RepID=A0A6I4I9K2_9SPHI|nr:nicotinamide riboside transporter PnuC [Mucilaginibacter aquatilis]MVN90668.1 nicotinamide riboside transporter PnuC [Mucilaginibacter aquatilis]
MHLLDEIINWFKHQSILELIGVCCGLLCVYLAARNNIWNWPFAIVTTGIYIYIFAQHGLYADMLQNAYLLCINIYGWYYWSRRPDKSAKMPVVHITINQVETALLITAAITPLLGFSLVYLSNLLNYSSASYPLLDSFCTVLSLTAQVYMARKVLENWLIWIFVDVIYVLIYASKNLEPTAIMFAIYALLAAKGYYDWRKELRLQQQQL